MKRANVCLLVGAIVTTATLVESVQAADMPSYGQVLIQQPPVPVVSEFEGWYLRGDIGLTQQQVKSLDQVLFASAAGFEWVDQPAFDTGIMGGLGIGYEWNHWLRLDVTGEYRGKTGFHAMDRFNNGGAINTNDYTATKSEWLFLANAYADLGTWWCITPFVGLGIGTVNMTIANFRDNNIIAGGGGYADEHSQWNLAWAIHAGLAYKVTQNFAVELAYRYLNLGDGKTADPRNLDGTNIVVNNPFTFNNITSHDFKLGLRWTCCDNGVAATPVRYAAPPPAYIPPPQPQVMVAPQPAPAAIYTQPAPTYAPPPPPSYMQPQYQPAPPAYHQPPLMRRG